jgi:hypothetical protein
MGCLGWLILGPFILTWYLMYFAIKALILLTVFAVQGLGDFITVVQEKRAAAPPRGRHGIR